MSEVIEVSYVLNSAKKQAQIELWEYDEKVEREDEVKIVFRYHNNILTQYSDNFFEALINLRKEIEPLGMRLLCKGCCKTVYPSAMLLNMGSGRKAYSLRIGEPATNDMLVDIFENCYENEYASVEAQEIFFKNWLDSIKSK